MNAAIRTATAGRSWAPRDCCWNAAETQEHGGPKRETQRQAANWGSGVRPMPPERGAMRETSLEARPESRTNETLDSKHVFEILWKYETLTAHIPISAWLYKLSTGKTMPAQRKSLISFYFVWWRAPPTLHTWSGRSRFRLCFTNHQLAGPCPHNENPALSLALKYALTVTLTQRRQSQSSGDKKWREGVSKPPNMSDLKSSSDSGRGREGFLIEVGTVVENAAPPANSYFDLSTSWDWGAFVAFG